MELLSNSLVEFARGEGVVDNNLHLNEIETSSSPLKVVLLEILETVDTVHFSSATSHVHRERSVNIWDRVGIFLSSLCALHCLLTPFLALLIPALGAYFHSEWVHLGLALFVAPVGIAAFLLGYRHHHNKGIVALGLLGVFAIVMASVLPHEWVEIQEVDVVTIVGSFILLAAHFWNRRACACGHKH